MKGILLRIPAAVDDQLRIAAARAGVSKNALIMGALNHALPADVGTVWAPMVSTTPTGDIVYKGKALRIDEEDIRLLLTEHAYHWNCKRLYRHSTVAEGKKRIIPLIVDIGGHGAYPLDGMQNNVSRSNVVQLVVAAPAETPDAWE
jgi:hypothetical protein